MRVSLERTLLNPWGVRLAKGVFRGRRTNGRCLRPKAEFRTLERASPACRGSQRFGAVSERDTLGRTINKKLSRIAIERRGDGIRAKIRFMSELKLNVAELPMAESGAGAPSAGAVFPVPQAASC